MTVLDRLNMLRHADVMTILRLGQSTVVIEREGLKYDASMLTLEEGLHFAEVFFLAHCNKELNMLRNKVKELEEYVSELERMEDDL